MADQLTIKINGDVKGLKDAMSEATGQTQALSDSLASATKTAAVAFAGLSAAIFGSVSAYRTQEQAEIKTRQTIKATGEAAGISAEEIFKMASSLQKVTTFGDEAIIGGQNLLLTFKNIGKDTFPRVTEVMLDMSEAMGTDLKSSAIQLGKALNDPAVGLTALSRVGITFDDTQKETIKTMQKSGDIAGAQAIILKELESQFGGVARASAKGTGKFIQFSNVTGDIVEKIGEKLVPTLLEVLKPLQTFVELLDQNKEFAETAAKILLVGSAIAGVAVAIGTFLLAAVKISAFITGLTTLFGAAGLAASGFWVAVTGPVGIAVAGLAAVAGGIAAIYSALNKEPSDSLDQINNKLEKMKEKREELAKFSGPNFPSNAAKLKEMDKEIEKIEELKIKKEESNQEEKEKEEEKKNAGLKRMEEKEAAQLEHRQRLRDQKAEQDEKDREKELENIEKNREQKLEQEEIDLGIKLEKEEADLERQILINKLKNDEDLKKINKDIKGTEDKEAKLELIKKRSDLIDKKRKDLELARTEDQQTKLEATRAFFRSKEVEGAKMIFNNLSSLSRSGNKTLFRIGQVASIASAITNTAEGVTNALAKVPYPLNIAAATSVGISGAVQIATIKNQKMPGFAKGGIVTGGIAGVDSVQIMAQQNELIAPVKNFDEVIGSVRARREAEKVGGAQGGAVAITVNYDSPEASRIVTVQQTEDAALGVSEDSTRV